MKRVLGAVALLCVVSAGVSGAGDVFEQLKVSKANAGKEVVEAFAYGYVNVSPFRNAFKGATPAARAAMVEQALVWTKAYVSSPQFAQAYAAHRASSKPVREQRISIDEELKQRKAQREADLAEAKKAVAEMPAEYRQSAEEGYQAALESMKQLDTAEFRKMERESLVQERQQEEQDHKEAMARWEEELPADPKQLVKKRLAEFLEATANVDYSAQLVAKYGKQRFAKEAYEDKPSEWKLAFRAGKEPTEKARALAAAWMKEL